MQNRKPWIFLQIDKNKYTSFLKPVSDLLGKHQKHFHQDPEQGKNSYYSIELFNTELDLLAKAMKQEKIIEESIFTSYNTLLGILVSVIYIINKVIQ